MLRIYLWLGIIVTFTDFNSIFHPIDSHVNLKVQIPIFWSFYKDPNVDLNILFWLQ